MFSVHETLSPAQALDAGVEGPPHQEFRYVSPEVVKKIEELPVSVGNKADLLLTGLGLKPAALAAVTNGEYRYCGEVITADPYRCAAYSAASAALGLATLTSEPRQTAGGAELVTFYSAHSLEAAKALKEADALGHEQEIGIRSLGRALGYPETATQAFIDGTSVLPWTVDPSLDMALSRVVNFKYSREHFQEELRLAQGYLSALAEVSPSIVRELADEGRRVRPANS